jgi:hypothetical protein
MICSKATKDAQIQNSTNLKYSIRNVEKFQDSFGALGELKVKIWGGILRVLKHHILKFWQPANS